MKLHVGDTVLVISGKDRGKTGSILRVMPTDNRVVVSGINIRTRHVKKTAQEAGRILKYEAALSASNVMILDPKSAKPSRIGYKVDEKGHKIRVSKMSGEEVRVVKPKVEKKQKKTEEAAAPKKEAKESKDSKDKKVPAKKGPFWKRMGFGADAMQDSDGKAPVSNQDHTIPDQQIHRSGGRGS